MNYLKTVALSTVIVSAAGMSHATTVDFDGFAEGTFLGNGTNLGGGIVADISASGPGSLGAVIFDTNPGSVSAGNDPDLVSDFTNAEDADDSRGFDNAVIIQEDQATSRSGPASTGPDDLGAGGTLTFDFINDVAFNSVFLLDAGEGSTVELLLDGNQVAFTALTAANESDTRDDDANEFTFLDFAGVQADTFILTLTSSGGLGEFDATAIAPVPVPASLPLLVGGFGVMAFMRRRRKAA